MNQNLATTKQEKKTLKKKSKDLLKNVVRKIRMLKTNRAQGRSWPCFR